MNPGITPKEPRGEYNDVWLMYFQNVLYDIVTAVRGSPVYGPNYKDIEKATPYPTETVVKFLRFAEKIRFITGKGGFYNHPGQGGAKSWYMADPASYDRMDFYAPMNAGKIPAYPYDWLTLYSDHKDDINEWLANHAIVIINDKGAVQYIAYDRADMAKEYIRLYADRYQWMGTPEKLAIVENKTPSPYTMCMFGKKKSPLPVKYDRFNRNWEFNAPDLFLA